MQPNKPVFSSSMSLVQPFTWYCCRVSRWIPAASSAAAVRRRAVGTSMMRQRSASPDNKIMNALDELVL
jgi:hypothetical protein